MSGYSIEDTLFEIQTSQMAKVDPQNYLTRLPLGSLNGMAVSSIDYRSRESLLRANRRLNSLRKLVSSTTKGEGLGRPTRHHLRRSHELGTPTIGYCNVPLVDWIDVKTRGL